MLVDKLHPLLQAHPALLVGAVVGILLGLLVLTWPLVSRFLRSGKKDLEVPTHVKTKYESQLAELEEQFASQDLSGRLVAQKLGELVRQFAFDAWGYKIDHMTLAELRRMGLRPVAHTVEHLYLAEFATEEATEVAPLFAEVRKLVGMWS
ncbi:MULTISPECIES: hypothetical protein [Brevibacterium]|uniref:DUF4381 domain-containing protein n=1 Tax=Brevibacterium paucivorans TaxID=170994 RepID=A0A2N6VMP3_9MICO|nr:MULTISPECIES: hypothetical protein [Brevibacterium]MCG7297868.1 hypothetical protein [Brevibacterium sp. ACRRH]PMD05293.1 hypothetical protein CJ199_09475 [Brevibacterium paucivorans]